VRPGDILVGKITPKSETELAPEERCSAPSSAKKAADVKDTSLKVPSGTYGIVMDVKVSSKKEAEVETKAAVSEENATPKKSKTNTKRNGRVARSTH